MKFTFLLLHYNQFEFIKNVTINTIQNPLDKNSRDKVKLLIEEV